MAILTKRERLQSWIELAEREVELRDSIASYDWSLRGGEPETLQEELNHVTRQLVMVTRANQLSQSIEVARGELAQLSEDPEGDDVEF